MPNSIGPHTCAKANPVRTDQPHAHRGRDARPKQASMRSHGHGLKWKSGTKREGPLVSISASGSGHAQQAPRGQTSEAPSAQRYCLVWSRKRAAAMRARDERMETGQREGPQLHCQTVLGLTPVRRQTLCGQINHTPTGAAMPGLSKASSQDVGPTW